MTRKTVSKKRPIQRKVGRVQRDQVITFRLSAEEADLIAKAADRAPLARYSRDAVLARAQQDAKGHK